MYFDISNRFQENVARSLAAQFWQKKVLNYLKLKSSTEKVEKSILSQLYFFPYFQPKLSRIFHTSLTLT